MGGADCRSIQLKVKKDIHIVCSILFDFIFIQNLYYILEEINDFIEQVCIKLIKNGQ